MVTLPHCAKLTGAKKKPVIRKGNFIIPEINTGKSINIFACAFRLIKLCLFLYLNNVTAPSCFSVLLLQFSDSELMMT